MRKQLGINQEEIPASRVIIETPERNIVIENPSVQRVEMQGQSSFQISGEISESEKQEFNEEDISLIAGKTGKSKEEAREALEETKDIAEAILKLSS